MYLNSLVDHSVSFEEVSIFFIDLYVHIYACYITVHFSFCLQADCLCDRIDIVTMINLILKFEILFLF